MMQTGDALNSREMIGTRFFSLSMFLLVVLYACNLRIDLMEVDAAQYASIGAEMLRTGSWLQVHHRGADYLDKPPLLFWCSAASMGIFGVNTIAAKLPGMLALLVGLFSLYRFCLIWYGKQVARISVLILASSQAFFLMSNDVKTDGLLMACILFSLWMFSVYLKNNSIFSLLGFSLGLSLALMSKGPLGFLLPVSAVVTHLSIKKEWTKILRPQTLLILPLVALFIFPMCMGLYEQFDLHPEKEVYGLHGPSGLRFFFWTQSFGRLTGEIYWKNDAPWYFFLLSMLWDFAPWVIFFWLFLVSEIRSRKIFQAPETMLIALFLFGMLGFSASQYKLPHYIFPLFGACAVLVARNLYSQTQHRTVQYLLLIFSLLFLFVPIVALLSIFPAGIHVFIMHGLFATAVIYLLFIRKKTFYAMVVCLIGFGFILSFWFYPSLLQYQSSSRAGKLFYTMSKPGEKLFAADASGHALDFYARQNSCAFKEAHPGDWLYTSQSFADSLLRSGGWRLMASFPDYPVSRLSGKFLFDRERNQKLPKRVLLKKE